MEDYARLLLSVYLGICMNAWMHVYMRYTKTRASKPNERSTLGERGKKQLRPDSTDSDWRYLTTQLPTPDSRGKFYIE